MVEQAWLIPVIPLASFFLIASFGTRLPRRGTEIAITGTAVTLLLSLSVAAKVIGDGGYHLERSVKWFDIGPLELELGMNIDGLAAMMFVVVTTVSLLVQIYSTGYMKHEPRYTWYFATLNLFTGSMLTLVIANNLFQLLIGWELVGICSYLLIGHFWEEKPNQDAAVKAFVTTRTGDVPFVFGIFVLTIAAGTTNIGEITHLVEEGAPALGVGLLTVAALLLFGGAIGKSAQFPLHVWLPDAMAGPTPVSALIHAATMVVAGVYLIGRLFAVFVASEQALLVVATIAGITMLIAALLAVVQNDIKRVLAYSTVSQLAYMVAGLSLGEHGYTPGLFHLFTHAFFKALLFLGAGAVIHAVHSNNMSDMGGLRKYMPVTFLTFLIGSAALSGIPPLAGFWSKDEIITVAFLEKHYVLWGTAMLTAILTAFYMTRAVLLTFFGEYRGHGEPHEAPRSMTGPLVVLAFLSVTVGFLGSPLTGNVFHDWVHFGHAEAGEFNLGFAAVSIIGALAGIAVGYRLYSRWRDRDPVTRLGPFYTLLDNKYFLDDAYLWGVVRPLQYPVARFVNWTNVRILDGIVNLVGWISRKLGRVTVAIDKNVVDGAVNRVAVGAGWTGGLLRYVQSGNVQRYAVLLFAGVVIMTVIFTRT